MEWNVAQVKLATNAGYPHAEKFENYSYPYPKPHGLRSSEQLGLTNKQVVNKRITRIGQMKSFLFQPQLE